MSSPHDTASFTLRNLPLPARLVLAAFVISVGFGYFAGLVQMHFTHAKAGKLLPTPDETVETYHGPLDKSTPISKLEKLIVTAEGPFTGSGTMRPAFFEKSGGWKTEIKERGEATVRKERETEIEVIRDWLRNGADRKAYEAKPDGKEVGEYVLPEHLAKLPLADEFKGENAAGQPVVLLRELFNKRCAECHSPDAGHPAKGNAPNYPLENYDQIAKYAKVQPKATGMSLEKLAMTTHAHWLSFAVLFMLTGLIFSFTSYPRKLRTIVAPLTLVVQMIDIACWWLARWDPFFGYMIPLTGGIVALSLGMQILGSLFNMFGNKGRLVLLLMMLVAVVAAGWVWISVVEPHLEQKAAEARAAKAG
jgi:hypothetical protein